jgi:predicted CXXCH cytochrome family protein
MKKKHMILLVAAIFAALVFGSGLRSGSAQSPLAEEGGGPPANKYADCLSCHDYRQNHHPVDIPPIGEIPFPLTDGRITCVTCHFGDHETGGANFLREGPYLPQRDICFKCHHREEYRGVNPHEMLDEDGRFRRIVGGMTVCVICHPGTPNPDVERTEDIRLRADVGFLCWRCHPPMVNALFQAQHLLVEPSREMRKNLEKSETEMDVLLPLVPRDRVTCSTCHNPHQKGVIRREAAAKGADAPDRLRVASPRLCFACHPLY